MADSVSQTTAQFKGASEGSLNELYERYLSLLDIHQKLRQSLNNHMSSGFMFLAQANFTGPTRNRYGQDYYDGRMQASVKISVNGSEKPFDMVTISLKPTTAPPGRNESYGRSATKGDLGLGVERGNFRENRYGGDRASHNPLNWFGILVPAGLRNAQTSFKVVVNEHITSLVNVSREMNDCEAKIRDIQANIAGHRLASLVV